MGKALMTKSDTHVPIKQLKPTDKEQFTNKTQTSCQTPDELFCGDNEGKGSPT